MSRRKKSFFTLGAVVLVAFSLVLSSCFGIRKFTMKPKVLNILSQGQVFVDLYPKADSYNTPGYPFVLVGLIDLDHDGTGKWDATQNYGGKYNSVEDPDLMSAALDNTSICQAQGVKLNELTGFTWKAYRSDTAIDPTTGNFTDNLRIKVLMSRAAGTDDDSFGQFVIVGGSWIDLSAGGPPSPLEVGCSSAIWSTYPFAGLILPTITIFPSLTFP